MPDNPSAFPVAEDHKVAADFPWTCGMTLRDYFAAKAMAGWLASYSNDGDVHPVLNECAESVAALSYEMADAMLAERSK